MASIGKIAELVGKGAGKAKLAAGKVASGASKAASSAASKAKSLNKKDIAASVRGATKNLPKKQPKFVGLSTDKTMGTGAKVAGGVAGAAAVAGVAKSASSGSTPDRQTKETGSDLSKVTGTKGAGKSSTKPAASSKPAAKPAGTGASADRSPKGVGTGRSADRMDVAKPKGSVYRAKKGDGLWQVAEKTVPKGQSVAAWWTQIKKLNSTNGKVNRTYQNTGVKLPAGAEPKDRGYGMPKSGGGAKSTKAN